MSLRGLDRHAGDHAPDAIALWCSVRISSTKLDIGVYILQALKSIRSSVSCAHHFSGLLVKRVIGASPPESTGSVSTCEEIGHVPVGTPALMLGTRRLPFVGYPIVGIRVMFDGAGVPARAYWS